jgi:hypothetical protein
MRTITAVLGAALGLLALAVPAAHAQGTMSAHYGGLRPLRRLAHRSHNITDKSGRVLGHTELRSSPINRGQNCVMTYNTGGRPFTESGGS